MSNFIMNVINGEIIKNIINPSIKFIEDLIKNKCIYTINLSSKFNLIEPFISKYCDNFPKNPMKIIESHDDSENYWNNGFCPDDMKDTGYQYFTYNGTPIILSYTSTKLTDEGSTYYKFYIYLKTIKTERNIENLNNFLRKMKKISDKELEKEKIKYTFKTGVNYHGRYSGSFSPIKRTINRTFDNVFIPEKQKAELLTAINKYITKHDWYTENDIPNHFGILLYGVPGGGKSSLAQAIANEIKGQFFVMNGDELNDLKQCISCYEFGRKPINDNFYRVLLIEDIDCNMITKRRKMAEKDAEYRSMKYGNNYKVKEPSLATILNEFDGINSPENIIYIFTTNHIEELDEALIRPGRIDLKLEIGYITNETLNMFTKKFYGKDFPQDVKIKNNMTFAELQTKVMQDMSWDKFIEYVKA